MILYMKDGPTLLSVLKKMASMRWTFWNFHFFEATVLSYGSAGKCGSKKIGPYKAIVSSHKNVRMKLDIKKFVNLSIEMGKIIY